MEDALAHNDSCTLLLLTTGCALLCTLHGPFTSLALLDHDLDPFHPHPLGSQRCHNCAFVTQEGGTEAPSPTPQL